MTTMPPDDIRRIYDKLEELGKELAGLNATVTANGKLLGEVRHAVGQMAIDGCAQGKAHAAAIKDLKERPEKTIGMAAAVAGLISGIGAALAWMARAGR